MKRLSTPQLADAYAKAARAAKDATKAADVLRKQVMERMEGTATPTLMGDLYQVDLTVSLRERLDQDEVRAILSKKQIAACTRQSKVATLNYHLHNEAVVGLKEVA